MEYIGQHHRLHRGVYGIVIDLIGDGSQEGIGGEKEARLEGFKERLAATARCTCSRGVGPAPTRILVSPTEHAMPPTGLGS
jgi:hypothetical protein